MTVGERALQHLLGQRSLCGGGQGILLNMLKIRTFCEQFHRN